MMPTSPLVALACLSAAVAAVDSAPSFEEFLARFGLKYSDSELPARRKLYQEHLAEIASHNARKDSLWTADVNDMSADTDQEFTGRLGSKGLVVEKAGGNKSHRVDAVGANSLRATGLRGAAPLPRNVDWREHRPSVVTPVKNQGKCGSCWAFAAAQVLESHIAIRTGFLVDMSPQQLTSCTQFPDDPQGGGCNGGFAEVALNYVAKSGISSQWQYPYLSGVTGQKGECFNDGPYASKRAGIANYLYLATNKAEDMMKAVAQHGPVAVSVDARQWRHYSSGVFDSCEDRVQLDHAVVLVGYGERQIQRRGLVHWWLVRNCWGSTWGERGYIRLRRYPGGERCSMDLGQRACGECGVLAEAAWAEGGFLGGKDGV